MFLAIDRVSKFTVVEFHDCAGKTEAAAFFRNVIAAFPYAIHAVLTDNGMAFADLPKNRGRHPEIIGMFGGHIFDRVCKEHGIEHRLTKPYHPWTNTEAERMNRTIKDATTKAFHHPSRDALKAHVVAFVTACNFAKHLKALRWRTHFQSICDAWAKDPSPFKINPHRLIPGPNTQCGGRRVLAAPQSTNTQRRAQQEHGRQAAAGVGAAAHHGAVPAHPVCPGRTSYPTSLREEVDQRRQWSGRDVFVGRASGPLRPPATTACLNRSECSSARWSRRSVR
jgi:transposase InsO family protein